MSSRALSLATVMLLIGCFAAIPVRAENLEAGKSPSQIFAGTCNACHKSPRGLLRTVSAGSLPGFLREHYTTSSDMAKLLSGFLIANGATDTRVGAKQAKDAKQDAGQGGPPEQVDRFGRRLRPPAPVPEAAKPDADRPSPQIEPGRRDRNAKRLARPGEAPDAVRPAVDGQVPAQAAIERGPDGRIARQKLGRRGKPGGQEPPPKTDADKPDLAKGEPPKGEAAKEDGPKSEAAKDEGGRPENTTPTSEGKPEAARLDGPKDIGSETPVLRDDPVPPVTPAPPASPTTSAAVSSGTPEPPPAPPESAATPAPAEATASAPPAAPAGPPAPPISQ